MSKIERLRGFKDYYPEDMQKREEIFSIMRKTAQNFGFLPIDYPSLEMLEIYRIKSGDELVGQTYNFRDKSNREITLIPEATPSTMRMLVSRKGLVKPVKWYNIPKLWRYEEPQSGRNREHYQFNADYFGETGMEIDAELIALACEILNRLGLKGMYVVRVNHRKLMEKILSGLGSENIQSSISTIDHFRKESIEVIGNKLHNDGITGDNLNRLLIFLSKSYPMKNIRDSMRELGLELSEDIDFLRMISTVEFLSRNGYENIVYDPSTVRGLSYYTGIVFEGFDFDGKFRSIFGGGRYDNLSQLFDGQEIPAVGFGMGDAVLENLLKEKNLWKVHNIDSSYFVIGIGRGGKEQAANVLYSLRKNGKTAVMENSDRNISNSLKHASAMNFTHAIMIGEKELMEGSLTVKNLISGEQRKISNSELNEL